ncbi:MAG TPA: hypothetical protein VFF15_07295 [Flavobacteriaceae bacterium]|nr:hypothetical protein [Flavobacteriaceae bacterium]
METKNKTAVNKTSELFKVRGNWEKQSQALIKKYPVLTPADVKFETGKEVELFNRLETKLNKSRNEVLDILKVNQAIVAKSI